VADNPRLEELRRRVQKDPASIAFAQLAEEHRRAGEFEDAIGVCRAGLEYHPTYLSARVTLGRALIAVGRYDEAEAELQQVLRAAPDNLAAIRALADIQSRIELMSDTQAQPRSAVPAAAEGESVALAALEAWLAAIINDRVRRGLGRDRQP
jgi:tetratricopeptide (TPR) repeat protein